MTLPESSSIHWRAEFYAPERIVVGEHVIIGDSAFLDGRSGLTIGDNVNLGSHVSIYTREHDVNSPTFAETGGPVVIGDRAWVSSHSVVLPGITIGEGAVVAAGAIVTKDVPPYTIVGRQPGQAHRHAQPRPHVRAGLRQAVRVTTRSSGSTNSSGTSTGARRTTAPGRTDGSRAFAAMSGGPAASG